MHSPRPADPLSDIESHRSEIVEQGCFSPGENLRIFDKWFTGTRPRDRLLAVLARRLRLEDKAVCDVGCAYGMHVLLGGEGSFGIELEKYQADFARSIGIQVFENDVLYDDLGHLPKADVILALAIIEHLDSPHIFLRKMHSLLNPGGVLVIETPRKPAFDWLTRLPLIGKVYGDHDDHINAFTGPTLRFFCERAGFRHLESLLWSKPLVNRAPFLPPLLTGRFPFSLVANGVVCIAQKIDGWEYLPKSTRRAATNPRGYEFRGMPFPEQASGGTTKS